MTNQATFAIFPVATAAERKTVKVSALVFLRNCLGAHDVALRYRAQAATMAGGRKRI
jgi:hypothetical protein